MFCASKPVCDIKTPEKFHRKSDFSEYFLNKPLLGLANSIQLRYATPRIIPSWLNEPAINNLFNQEQTMQKMKWSVIAFAVAAASTQMAVASQQSESNGFVEDSKLDLHARTLYFNRDFRNEDSTQQSYREDLGLGLKAIYESGFTQGTVGFGVDAFAMTGIRLDGGRGRNGNNQFPTRGNGKPETSYGQVGGAVKARLSNTTLKYGEQFVDLPVLSTDDSRLLPESTTGFLVTSEELDGVVLHAGHFTAISALDQTGRDSNADVWLRSIDLIGGRYNFTNDLSAAYYYADADL